MTPDGIWRFKRGKGGLCCPLCGLNPLTVDTTTETISCADGHTFGQRELYRFFMRWECDQWDEPNVVDPVDVDG